MKVSIAYAKDDDGEDDLRRPTRFELADGVLNLATYYVGARGWTWTGRRIDETALDEALAELSVSEAWKDRIRQLVARAPWSE